MVLVVLVNSLRDWDIIQAEHWYRIPVKRAPVQLTHASYVAFYLARAFGENKWSIRHYARVRGHELVRRRDLFPNEPEHPRAEEAYYKLQLSPVLELPRPISSSRGRRLLFIWTNGSKLSRAVELNDLFGKSAGDDALWEALKEGGIGADRQVIVRDARGRYRVDYMISANCGHLAIVLTETRRRLPKAKNLQTLVFSEEDALVRRHECMTQINRALRELGGAKYACTE